MTSGTATATHTVLATVRQLRADADRAEAGVLACAVEWAALHQVTDVAYAATWGDSPVPLAGEGAPLVSEFAVVELAAALGMSTESGRNLIAQGLELKHRLPRLWARVESGSLQAWRARRIAEETLSLSIEAADYVDAQISHFAHRTGPAQTQRLVDEAIATFMPELAKERHDAAMDGRHFTIDRGQTSFAGTSLVTGELDQADARDLEEAVRAGAAQLADLGSEESLDVRRSLAVGLLARGESPLPLEPGAPIPPVRRRDIVLYAHLDQSGLAKVEGHGLLTAEQIKTWCGSSNVVIKPVIDVNKPISTSAYEIPDKIREQVVLRDGTCVFAYCTRNARRADIDHIEPFDPDGPGDQTATDKLAPLCRLHHRVKTFGGWSYVMLQPGVYLWRSPQGFRYLRSCSGTQDVTGSRRTRSPGPEPPGPPTS